METRQESSISEAEAYMAKAASNSLGDMGSCVASRFAGAWLFSVRFRFRLAKLAALQERHNDRRSPFLPRLSSL